MSNPPIDYFAPSLLRGAKYLKRREVEVVRVSLVDTIHGEVISLRARKAGGRIQLRLVDEYETEFELPYTAIDAPLSAEDLIKFLASCDPSPFDNECQLEIESQFYKGLQKLLDQLLDRKREWATAEDWLEQLQSQDRSSPDGFVWHQFWEWLAEAAAPRDGEPPMPFILAAAGESAKRKIDRLREQLRWAHDRGRLAAALRWLDARPPRAWHICSPDRWELSFYPTIEPPPDMEDAFGY